MKFPAWRSDVLVEVGLVLEQWETSGTSTVALDRKHVVSLVLWMVCCEIDEISLTVLSSQGDPCGLRASDVTLGGLTARVLLNRETCRHFQRTSAGCAASVAQHFEVCGDPCRMPGRRDDSHSLAAVRQRR